MPDQAPKKNLIIAGTIFLLVLLIVTLIKSAGDSLYSYTENSNLSNLDSSTLITVLAGGRGRISTALELYANGNGIALYVAGAGRRSTRESIMRDYLEPELSKKLDENRIRNIFVETQSRNTIENAYAISRFTRNNPEIKVIVLVTSAYHMRRSELILKNALRSKALILLYTADSTINKRNWFNSYNGIIVTMLEWGKFTLAKIFIPLLEIF